MTVHHPTPGTVSARSELTAGIMAKTGLDEAVLRTLVHTFYARIHKDDMLGPIFADNIDDWEPHLERMVAFWSSVALMTGRYQGRPVPAHTPLPIEAAHFNRWLQIFRATAQEICTPEGAAHVTLRAERIARSLHIAVVEAQAAPDSVPSLFLQQDTQMADNPPIHDAAKLTLYIETRYHMRHRGQLNSLAAMAEKVETVHYGHENVPEGLSELLRRMIGKMETHMKKEELILFPAIRKGGGPGIENPISVMRADHHDHSRAVAEIRNLTRDLTLPQGACSTWTRLYDGLSEFIEDLTEHMRLENDVLFPQFEPSSRVNV